MFVILDESQKEELCNKVEALFSVPSPVDGTCGIFTMPEQLIKDRADYFNSCLMSVYSSINNDGNSIGMFEIVSALDEYFDLGFLVKNVLSNEVLSLIAEQLKDFMQTRCKNMDISFSDSKIPSDMKNTVIDILKGDV